MNNFDFHVPTRILFGKGEEKQIGRLLKPYAKKVLLHYGAGSIKGNGIYDSVTESLKASGIEYIELSGVIPNPRLSLVLEGVKLCKKENVELILAVGGGSVIDSAKAIAIGVYEEGPLWEIYEQKKEIERALPVATILTIPAAGSESSKNTVITNEEKDLKLGYGDPHLRPVLSIVNPAFFFSLPKNQIANGVADMMSHIFERYFTNTLHTDLTDGLCESTLKTIMRNALIVIENQEDYDAWAEIGFSGTIAHNGLLGMGREEDWACHGMEHELSAIYDIPHGAGLAILTPAWMQYVYKENMPLFHQFARQVMGVEGSCREEEKMITEAIKRLRAFYQKMGLPGTLREIGIDETNFELMAKKATSIPHMMEPRIGGLKKLDWKDIVEIYKLAK